MHTFVLCEENVPSGRESAPPICIQVARHKRRTVTGKQQGGPKGLEGHGTGKGKGHPTTGHEGPQGGGG
jgi:hypothetical protein